MSKTKFSADATPVFKVTWSFRNNLYNVISVWVYHTCISHIYVPKLSGSKRTNNNAGVHAYIWCVFLSALMCINNVILYVHQGTLTAIHQGGLAEWEKAECHSFTFPLVLGVPADGLWANWISPGEVRRDWSTAPGAEGVNWASLGDSFYSSHHFRLLFLFSPLCFFASSSFPMTNHTNLQKKTREPIFQLDVTLVNSYCDNFVRLFWKNVKREWLIKLFFWGEWS